MLIAKAGGLVPQVRVISNQIGNGPFEEGLQFKSNLIETDHRWENKLTDCQFPYMLIGKKIFQRSLHMELHTLPVK